MTDRAKKNSWTDGLAQPAPSHTKKDIKKNQAAYMFEAGFEYFISLLITDAFLATLLTRAGFTDSQTGIITQLASLALSAQLVSVFVRKTKGLKLWFTLMHIANQLMFVGLYGVALFDIPSAVKGIVFVALFLGGHFIANLVSPYKLPWMMSFVPDSKRGVYTAVKEMTSLVGGMVTSFVMGSVVDWCNAKASSAVAGGLAETAERWQNTGLIICALTVLGLAVLHAVSILVMKDRTPAEIDAVGVKTSSGAIETLKSTVTNKIILKLIVIDVFWQFAVGFSTAFYGVYKIGELGFSLQYVSVIAIVGSIARLAISMLFGSIADKRSWTTMLSICFAIAAASFGVNIFTVPSNGKLLFLVHTVIYYISLGGISSGMWNIYFDFVPSEERAAALGIKNTVGGLVSFLASLAGGALLGWVQSADNQVFGIHVYAQQIQSAVSFVVIVGLVFYMRTVIAGMKRRGQ